MREYITITCRKCGNYEVCKDRTFKSEKKKLPEFWSFELRHSLLFNSTLNPSLSASLQVAPFESVANIGTVNIKKLVAPTLILILILLTTILITSLSQVAHAQMITCPNTSPNDLDGDGTSNIQETKGIDSNNDGKVDLNLTALGANPLHKDIFLEIDYMKHHKPSQAGIDNLTKTFQNSPVCNPDGVTGIALHTRVDDEVPHIDVLPIECVQGGNWSGFNSLKKTFFGTVEDRHDPNARNILAAKDFLNHYAIFIHQYTNQFGTPSGSSGCSDPPRMNMVVSLGGWQNALGRDPNTNDVRSNPDYEVGTLMHELGHTLNLGHGGSDWNTNYMPNYLSVMNYNFQFPSPVGTRPLDYSRCAITTLDENNLDEHRALGLSCPPGLYSWSGYHNGDQICPPDKLLITNSSFDWNDNGESSDSRLSKDVNCDHSLTKMKGYDDWHHISYIRDRNHVGSNVGGMGSAQGQQPYSHEDRTVQSVLEDRSVLLSNLNETTKGLPPPIQEFYSSQIGLSNATNGTEITIPSNASTGVVVSNATGSFVVQNASSITIPSNASTSVVVSNATGSFFVQNGTKLPTDTTGVPDNATVSNSSGVIVSNATHATISNSSGVVVSNATGSFVVNNATSMTIPSNATSGGTVKNTTTLADLIVKSNDIPGAIKKIDKLAKTADSSVGGDSNGDLVVDRELQQKMTAELDNLKSVLAKQASSPASSSSGMSP